MAAAVGALLGIAVAYGMVLDRWPGAFASQGDFNISYSVKPTSIVIAYAIGVLLTLVVVAFSAWRVSRMNIVTAIRNLPEPPAEKAHAAAGCSGDRSSFSAVRSRVSGVSSKDAIVLGLGVSLVILSLVPIAQGARRARARRATPTAGLALVLWFVLPISRWLFGDLKVNFSIFILAGLMIVVGATWTIMYNADILLRRTQRHARPHTAGWRRCCGCRSPTRCAAASAPASPLAMFTLVVFTLVVGAITTGSFVNAFNDLEPVRRRLRRPRDRLAGQPDHQHAARRSPAHPD